MYTKTVKQNQEKERSMEGDRVAEKGGCNEITRDSRYVRGLISGYSIYRGLLVRI